MTPELRSALSRDALLQAAADLATWSDQSDLVSLAWVCVWLRARAGNDEGTGQ